MNWGDGIKKKIRICTEWDWYCPGAEWVKAKLGQPVIAMMAFMKQEIVNNVNCRVEEMVRKWFVAKSNSLETKPWKQKARSTNGHGSPYFTYSLGPLRWHVVRLPFVGTWRKAQSGHEHEELEVNRRARQPGQTDNSGVLGLWEKYEAQALVF